MKRIFLLLATVSLALISCVEDNLTPDQAAEGTVTIKAVAADTKTTLNDRAVVWENSDKFKVVYHSFDQSADFSVKGSVSGATANFTGTVNPEWALKEKVHPYAVYPATAVTEVTGITTISHTLPEVQTGTITSGMNLSSAVLSEEDLAAGNAEAVFHNALTLLQIVVPEGVASVELSANYGLVGTSTFYVHEQDGTAENTGDYDDEDNPLYADVKATGKLTVKSFSNKKTVTLQNGDVLDATKTHSVLVYPGNTTLALTMTGTDGATYSSSIDYVTLLAGECRLIDLTKIFRMETQEEMFISPAGGECPVKIYATEAYDYNVTIENGEWLSYELPTRALINEAIVFKADENTTGATRTANVTITWGENTRTFKMSQKAVYTDFLNDENGNPIQWQETFGVYASEQDAMNGTNAKSTFANVFTISISDELSKGTYKIENMFKTPTGAATYYADYADGELTLYTSSAASPSRSYYFKDDEVVLTYDSANKTFKSKVDPILAGTKFDFPQFGNKACFIGGYSVAVKAEEPGSGDATGVETLYGTYNESVIAPYNSTAKEKLVISESDDASYDLKMLFFYSEGESSGSYETAYGKVSEDGKTITVTIPGYSNYYGPVSDFTLTVDGTTISGRYCGKMDYSATI